MSLSRHNCDFTITLLQTAREYITRMWWPITLSRLQSFVKIFYVV